MRWLVTGGAGFIGSHFVRTALSEGWVDSCIVLDALTYAGNRRNLAAVNQHRGLLFVHGDITSRVTVEQLLTPDISALFHFAAESHVDRSIVGADTFVRTNVQGTQILLDAARKVPQLRFMHISTDEVYGALALNDPNCFNEDTPLNPTSPYAASKAGSDFLVIAAHRTHGLDTVITRCSNNYGPYQHPEKFIPLFISRALKRLSLPMYGDGAYVRDWIHVDNHCRGIYAAYQKAQAGSIYNLGGECERSNIHIAQRILQLTDCPPSCLTYVTDRLGHDRRYAVDCHRAKTELQFDPGEQIETRLEDLVQWYRHHDWHEQAAERNGRQLAQVRW